MRFLVWNNPNGHYAFIAADWFDGWEKYRKLGYHVIAVVIAENYSEAYWQWRNRRNAVGR